MPLPNDPITSADTNSWLRGEKGPNPRIPIQRNLNWEGGGSGTLQQFHSEWWKYSTEPNPEWKVYGNHVREGMPNMCVRTERWPESCRNYGPKSHRPKGSTHTHTHKQGGTTHTHTHTNPFSQPRGNHTLDLLYTTNAHLYRSNYSHWLYYINHTVSNYSERP